MIFGIFLLSGRLTAHKALQKVVKFLYHWSYHLSHNFKPFLEMNPILWQVIVESCCIFIIWIKQPSLKQTLQKGALIIGDLLFMGTCSIPLSIKNNPSNLILIAWYWDVSLSKIQNELFCVYLIYFFAINTYFVDNHTVFCDLFQPTNKKQTLERQRSTLNTDNLKKFNARKRWMVREWAAPSEIHTPSLENFGKVNHMESEFSNTHLLCDFLVVTNELIYFVFTLPLCQMSLKSSTVGVWNSNGVTQYSIH